MTVERCRHCGCEWSCPDCDATGKVRFAPCPWRRYGDEQPEEGALVLVWRKGAVGPVVGVYCGRGIWSTLSRAANTDDRWLLHGTFLGRVTSAPRPSCLTAPARCRRGKPIRRLGGFYARSRWSAIIRPSPNWVPTLRRRGRRHWTVAKS